MDVFGKHPANETGEYFRNSVWSWRPLAEYITENAPKQITSKCQYWQSNDGDGLNKSDALALSIWLQGEIASGRTKVYADNRDAKLSALPMLECKWCEGTGTRSDNVGVANGMTTRLIDEEGHPRNGQTGWCNGCHGVGKVAQDATLYPFSVENVEEFATFLEACGGFRIK
jgi:hypothetical protein